MSRGVEATRGIGTPTEQLRRRGEVTDQALRCLFGGSAGGAGSALPALGSGTPEGAIGVEAWVVCVGANVETGRGSGRTTRIQGVIGMPLEQLRQATKFEFDSVDEAAHEVFPQCQSGDTRPGSGRSGGGPELALEC
ncbi:MAG: hypothetical protein CL927_03360 [Deltaproteobacteria bacterium]|nr:hypothetical protein [Deltaproteobacteria bacterium]